MAEGAWYPVLDAVPLFLFVWPLGAVVLSVRPCVPLCCLCGAVCGCLCARVVFVPLGGL